MLRYSTKTVFFAKLSELLVASLKWCFVRRPAPKLLDRDDLTVVLIEPFQLGDVLSLSVMIDPLKRQYPRGHVIVCCHSKNAHLYDKDDRIFHIIHAPYPWSSRGSKRGTIRVWISVLKSCYEMREYKPDVGIDVRGDVRSQILMVLGGCVFRTGYTTYVASNLTLHGWLLSEAVSEPGNRHRFFRNLHALSGLFKGITPALRLPAFGATRRQLSSSECKVVLHLGAGWFYRRWPLDRWVLVISELQRLQGVELVVIAGPDEQELVTELNARLTTKVDIVSTSIDGMFDTIGAADLFIGLDSGPMNAASLMNVPALVLFGPGESEVWRPLSDGSEICHHVEGYPCHPCTQIVCVRPQDPCMTAIRVEEVLARATRMLGSDLVRITPAS